MSLQVWLPLNGNLNNQGLSEVTITNSGATVNSSGKIGSCYSFNGSNNKIQISNAPKPNNISVAMWFKRNATTNTRQFLYTQWQGITLELDGANKITCSVNTADGQVGYCKTTTTITADSGWTHIVYTFEQGVGTKLYINGSFIQSESVTKPIVWSNNAGNIGYYSTYFNGCVNDFRIYDHCLSDKEIKEISKGLILHYKLSNQYETGQTNKYSSPYSDGECSSSSFTKTKLTNERGYNYKLTRTGDGANSWPNWNVPNYSFTAGKTYYYSVKIRCNKWTSGNLVLRASRSNNDWVTNGVTICSPSLADGKWHEYYTYQTVNENYDRSGTTVTSNPVLEFYCSNQNSNGTIYDMDFDVKDVQVVESDCYVPFIENSFIGTTIYDCSGYGNNGIKNNIIISSDSARYISSYVFNGSSSYINAGTGAKITDTISVNIWIKYTTWGNPISCTEGGGWNFENNGGYVSFPLYVASVGYKVAKSTKTPANLADGKWHMLTGTFDRTNVKVYIDGVLEGTTATGSTNGVGYHASNSIMIGAEAAGGATPAGTYLTGNISDVRIYATALSADDVKELYQVSASIDNMGNLYSYEVVEQ